jgi:polyphosphate kinase 2 (PPK2 family)
MSKKEDKPKKDKKQKNPKNAVVSAEVEMINYEAVTDRKKIGKKEFEEEIYKLQIELIKLQEWVKAKKLKVVVIFEGRDAAGKGGVIHTIAERLNPRFCRVVALGVPTEKEKTQWYFQRYVPYLPAAGEMVLFDRSWYNRAGVERVMGFCTEEEYTEFLRFAARNEDPVKRWKLSPMDIESRNRWVEYSKAKDVMFAHTDIKQAPWHVVVADDKKRARLNCIHHLLSQIDYEDLTPPPIKLPKRVIDNSYVRPPMTDQNFVPNVY